MCLLEQACFHEAIFKELPRWKASQAAAKELRRQRNVQDAGERAEADRLMQKEQARERAAAKLVERATTAKQAVIDFHDRRKYHAELAKTVDRMNEEQERFYGFDH